MIITVVRVPRGRSGWAWKAIIDDGQGESAWHCGDTPWSAVASALRWGYKAGWSYHEPVW